MFCYLDVLILRTPNSINFRLQLANTLRINAMFVPDSVNPTIWTLGHVVLVHAHQVFEKYKQGLGVVTMEGREAKQIFLKKLSENATYQGRWHDIFKY